MADSIQTEQNQNQVLQTQIVNIQSVSRIDEQLQTSFNQVKVDLEGEKQKITHLTTILKQKDAEIAQYKIHMSEQAKVEFK